MLKTMFTLPFYLVNIPCLIGYVLIRQGQKLLGTLSFHFLCAEVRKQSLIEDSTISVTEMAISKGFSKAKSFFQVNQTFFFKVLF